MSRTVGMSAAFARSRKSATVRRLAGPQVTLHFAQSLDGCIGLGSGRERAILSSEEGVVSAHRARCQHDAVLVGIDTVLHDDPRLTARGSQGAQPLRVVLDSELRLPLTARLLQANEAAGGVLIFGCAERAPADRRRQLEAAGAVVLLTSADRQRRVVLLEALEALAARGVQRLLVEGGARVLTSFLQAGLAARAEIEIAPLWLGAPQRRACASWAWVSSARRQGSNAWRSRAWAKACCCAATSFTRQESRKWSGVSCGSRLPGRSSCAGRPGRARVGTSACARAGVRDQPGHGAAFVSG